MLLGDSISQHLSFALALSVLPAYSSTVFSEPQGSKRDLIIFSLRAEHQAAMPLKLLLFLSTHESLQ